MQLKIKERTVFYASVHQLPYFTIAATGIVPCSAMIAAKNSESVPAAVIGSSSGSDRLPKVSPTH